MTNYIQTAFNYFHLPIAITDEGARSQQLSSAIQNSDIVAIATLAGTDPSSVNKPLPNGDLPANQAARENKHEALKTLLSLGADPTLKDDQGLSAIDYALLRKNDKSLGLIVNHFAAADIEKATALIQNKPAYNAASKIIKQVEQLAKSYNPEKTMLELDYQLHKAVLSKDLNYLKGLLHNPQIRNHLNNTDTNGLTALHYAAALGRQDMIQALVTGGANVRQTTADGLSPFDLLGVHAANKNPLNIGKVEAFVCVATLAAWAIQLVPLSYHTEDSYLASLAASMLLDGMADTVRYASTFETWKGYFGSFFISSILASDYEGNPNVLLAISAYPVYKFARQAFSGLNSCYRNASLGTGQAVLKAIAGPLTSAKIGFKRASQVISAANGNSPLNEDVSMLMKQVAACKDISKNHQLHCLDKAITSFGACQLKPNSEACADANDAYVDFLNRATLYARRNEYNAPGSLTPGQYYEAIRLLDDYSEACYDDLESVACVEAETAWKIAYKIGEASSDACNEAFETLGCVAEQTRNACKKAYNRLSLQYHPDRPNGSQEEFVKIGIAWEKAQECIQLNNQ